MQKDANLVELEKCCQTHIFLQNFVSIQPRTSPPKICKINFFKKSCRFANFAHRRCTFDEVGLPGCWIGPARVARGGPGCVPKVEELMELCIDFPVVLDAADTPVPAAARN